jgi:hypothetical protein
MCRTGKKKRKGRGDKQAEQDRYPLTRDKVCLDSSQRHSTSLLLNYYPGQRKEIPCSVQSSLVRLLYKANWFWWCTIRVNTSCCNLKQEQGCGCRPPYRLAREQQEPKFSITKPPPKRWTPVFVCRTDSCFADRRIVKSVDRVRLLNKLVRICDQIQITAIRWKKWILEILYCSSFWIHAEIVCWKCKNVLCFFG